ncbi:addiction module protein [Thiomicrorhabdus indica]|uniref:addiction module protein n=1 Tax=Thiomicrorhabdus indica TaxID=2267253 RepID=UPI00102D9355|nr:addiction module protein [Thiomicrorhabdus indica]
MDIADISQMSISERLQIMEAVWDSLTHEKSDISPPKWHEEVLSQRKEMIENGEATFTSIEELRSKHKV